MRSKRISDIEDYIYQPTDFVMSVFNAYEKCLLERERNRSYQKLHRNVEDILVQKKRILFYMIKKILCLKMILLL